MARRYYNFFFLLICVCAFPIQVVALNNLNFSNSSICYFHLDDLNDHDSQNIKCDHCTYYFDLHSSKVFKKIFLAYQNVLVIQPRQQQVSLNYILNLNPRSPPLV